MLDDHIAIVKVPNNNSTIMVKTTTEYGDGELLEGWFAYKGLRQYKNVNGRSGTFRYFEQLRDWGRRH